VERPHPRQSPAGPAHRALGRHAGGLHDDLRHAARLLVKTPGFTLLAVLMLALGTGANAALFSVVDAVLLRSPYGRVEEIAQVGVVAPNGRATVAVPRDAYDRLVRQTHIVAAAGTYTSSSPVATGIDVPRRTQVECVPASMIDVLGAPLLIGRWFSAAEDRPGGPGVGVVSFRFWQNDLHGDVGVVGRTIALDGEPLTVVGVMRRGFNGVLSLASRDLWVPVGQADVARPRYGCRPRADTVNAFVRLQPELSADAATQLLTKASGVNDPPDGATRLVLLSLSEQLLGNLRGPFLALLGAVLAVLLIACANVTNLGLERLVGRQREMAVRIALGASRSRIVRQTVTEQLLLAAIGAAAGVVLAYVALDALIALLPRTLPHFDEIQLNGRVLAASIGLALTCALGVGLFPAIRTSAVNLHTGLTQRDGGTSPGSRAIRRLLVVSELSLGVTLLVGALLMIQTFLTLRPSAPGFDPRDKTVALIRLPGDLPLGDRQRFFDDVSREVMRLRGVRGVAGTTYVPMSRSVDVFDMSIGDTRGRAFTATISPNYLDLMGVALRRGRALTDADGPRAPSVAVVNEAFVRRWLAGREPIGASVQLDLEGGGQPLQIVGVIADMRSWGADTLARPEIYLPFGQIMLGSPYFIVHADPRARALLPASLREVVGRIRPGQLVDRIEGLETLLAAEVARPRFGAWLFGLLAALAVTLAALGLAATLAWSVAERRREIGVRMALGARPRQIGSLVVGQTLLLSSVGIVIGLSLAAFGTRLLEGWLYGVTRLDAATFAACAGLMLVVSLAAGYLPARRAARIDPLITLRSE
jgi:putative ABC transport system permease protein